MNTRPIGRNIDRIIRQYCEVLGLDCSGVTFRWLQANDSILGAFYWQKPDTIYIKDIKTSSLDPQTYIEMLMPTVAHELTHRKQYLENPCKYIILSCRWIAKYTIEPEAEAQELKIAKKIERLKR